MILRITQTQQQAGASGGSQSHDRFLPAYTVENDQRYGDASTKDHIVYGGRYNSESGSNGVRLANIMISDKPEGARFALIREDAPLPKGHPETRQK